MSEDCQKCGTAMHKLDEERLCPGCGNHDLSDLDRVTAERDALQQRLTAADERVDQAETIIRKWKAIFGESMARRSELYVMTDEFLAALKLSESGGDAQ